MTEKAAVKTLREALVLKGAHVQRIEDSLSKGIPDINFCHEGVEAWIEVKELLKLPTNKSGIVKIGLRIEQALWLSKRQRAKGKVFIVIRCRFDNTWRLIKGDFFNFVKGINAKQFELSFGYPNIEPIVRDILRITSNKEYIIT